MTWETVIGLEIHTQLSTQSKIFSGAATAFGASPNTQACGVDLGLPGVLPVLNGEAVTMAIRFGLAIGAHIAPRSVFARKNYFYPDLPKGYQISQYEAPIVGAGSINIHLDDGVTKTIGITRAHLEEDAGKSVHDAYGDATGVDLNRAGTPLLEIVSEPDMRSAFEAIAYLRTIHTLVRYLRISDANMQEGSFRCDVNISIRAKGDETLGTRTELKNLNSFRFIDKAIEYEVERQIEVLEAGGKIVQETRLYDVDKDVTRSMRGKEEAHDYRYFPDPDLLPVEIAKDTLDEIAQSLPELPEARRQRFKSELKLSDDDADLISASRELADYFEAVVVACGGDAKLSFNWVSVELLGHLNRDGKNLSDSPVKPDAIGQLIRRIKDGTISGKIAKQIFAALWTGKATDTDAYIEAQGLKQLSDGGAIEQIVDEVITANPQQVAQYQGGKAKLLGFFVGQVMKKSQGRANPEQVNAIIKDKLGDPRG